MTHMIAIIPLTAVTMGVTAVLSRTGCLHRVMVAFFAATNRRERKEDGTDGAAREKPCLPRLSFTVQLANVHPCTLPIKTVSAQMQAESVGAQVELDKN